MKINTYEHIQPNFNEQCQSKKNQGLTNVNQSDSRGYKGNRIQAVKNSINKFVNVVNKSHNSREPIRNASWEQTRLTQKS